MKSVLKRMVKYILLFFALYVCSIGVLEVLSLFGASYGNRHSVAFTATLFAMIVLHAISYSKRKKSN